MYPCQYLSNNLELYTYSVLVYARDCPKKHLGLLKKDYTYSNTYLNENVY